MKEKYNIHTLRNSIVSIVSVYMDGNDEKTAYVMKSLKDQLKKGVDSINFFRSMHEDNTYSIHCYILAISFYLDHYEIGIGDPGDSHSQNQ